MAAYHVDDGDSIVLDHRQSVPTRSDKSVVSLASVQEDDENKSGTRKSSEWAIRPLKVKFKIKELEKIYKRSVYRQQQQLLIFVCILEVFISILVFLVFLGRRKVC